MILTFTETVQVNDSLYVTEITIQAEYNITNDTFLTYTLIDIAPYESDSMDKDGPIFTKRLGSSDLNALKYCSELSISVNDTYLTITNLTVVDMNDIPVVKEEIGIQCCIHS